jgi:hypothetical protein
MIGVGEMENYGKVYAAASDDFAEAASPSNVLGLYATSKLLTLKDWGVVKEVLAEAEGEMDRAGVPREIRDAVDLEKFDSLKLTQTQSGMGNFDMTWRQ